MSIDDVFVRLKERRRKRKRKKKKQEKKEPKKRIKNKEIRKKKKLKETLNVCVRAKRNFCTQATKCAKHHLNILQPYGVIHIVNISGAHKLAEK